jgi:hypothetical protein
MDYHVIAVEGIVKLTQNARKTSIKRCFTGIFAFYTEGSSFSALNRFFNKFSSCAAISFGLFEGDYLAKRGKWIGKISKNV